MCPGLRSRLAAEGKPAWQLAPGRRRCIAESLGIRRQDSLTKLGAFGAVNKARYGAQKASRRTSQGSRGLKGALRDSRAPEVFKERPGRALGAHWAQLGLDLGGSPFAAKGKPLLNRRLPLGQERLTWRASRDRVGSLPTTESAVLCTLRGRMPLCAYHLFGKAPLPGAK